MRQISAEDLRSFHARYYQPENCVLAVVGDITSDDAFARATRFFSSWTNATPPAMALLAEPKPSQERQVIAVDKPDAVQTEFRIGNLAVPRNSPDYLALSVANEILGGALGKPIVQGIAQSSGTYVRRFQRSCVSSQRGGLGCQELHSDS